MGKGRSWTKQELTYLKKYWPIVIDPNKMAAKMGRTYSAVRQKALLLGLSRTRQSMAWPPDKVRKLRKLYPDHTNEEIAKRLGTTKSAVDGAAFQLRLLKDPEWKREVAKKGQFKKGHIPKNKGKRWDEYLSKEKQESVRKTCFKKGQMPKNHKPVGYERKTRDGYWEVKVAEPNVFKAKHRILWEQHHGPIPKGVNIVFIDGNPDNITISNLRMESLMDKFNRCCSIHTTLPPEIRKLVQLKGTLKRQLNRIERSQTKEDKEEKQ